MNDKNLSEETMKKIVDQIMDILIDRGIDGYAKRMYIGFQVVERAIMLQLMSREPGIPEIQNLPSRPDLKEFLQKVHHEFLEYANRYYKASQESLSELN